MNRNQVEILELKSIVIENFTRGAQRTFEQAEKRVSGSNDSVR